MATAKPQLVIQPQFAPQIQNIAPALGTNMAGFTRGYMIWAQAGAGLGYTGGELGDGRDIIHFLFNPSTVSSDYNVGNASLQAAMMYTVPGDSGNLLSPLLQQTVSWQLYFDRTFELKYGGNSSAVNDPAVIGVEADIYQFKQFTGVNAMLNKQQANLAATNTSVVNNLGSQIANQVTTGGIMMMIPSYVFFGNALAQMTQNANSSNFGAVGAQMSYYGFISEWTPNYTHFTRNMIPIRASISVSFTMLPAPPSATQQAIWRDNQKLGTAPYTVATPYAPGYTPPPSLVNP